MSKNRPRSVLGVLVLLVAVCRVSGTAEGSAEVKTEDVTPVDRQDYYNGPPPQVIHCDGSRPCMINGPNVPSSQGSKWKGGTNVNSKPFPKGKPFNGSYKKMFALWRQLYNQYFEAGLKDYMASQGVQNGPRGPPPQNPIQSQSQFNYQPQQQQFHQQSQQQQHHQFNQPPPQQQFHHQQPQQPQFQFQQQSHPPQQFPQQQSKDPKQSKGGNHLFSLMSNFLGRYVSIEEGPIPPPKQQQYQQPPFNNGPRRPPPPPQPQQNSIPQNRPPTKSFFKRLLGRPTIIHVDNGGKVNTLQEGRPPRRQNSNEQHANSNTNYNNENFSQDPIPASHSNPESSPPVLPNLNLEEPTDSQNPIWSDFKTNRDPTKF